jgi:hypothetical protein
MTTTPAKGTTRPGTDFPDAVSGDLDDESVIAAGIPLAGLLGSGWRPADLPTLAAGVWWVGVSLAFVGTAGFAWAGCPVLSWEIPVATRQKSICIRGGVMLYMFGTAAAAVAVFVTPA